MKKKLVKIDHWKLEIAQADFYKFAYADGNKALLDALAKR
jgi:hypothetical protein